MRSVLQEVPLYIASNVVQTVLLSAAEAVPSSAVRNHGIAQQSDGAVYVVESASAYVHVQGTMVREDGAVVVIAAAPEIYLGGLGHLETGELCVIDSGTAADFNQGVPCLNGKVRVNNL